MLGGIQFISNIHRHTHTCTMEYYSGMEKKEISVICDKIGETGKHLVLEINQKEKGFPVG